MDKTAKVFEVIVNFMQNMSSELYKASVKLQLKWTFVKKRHDQGKIEEEEWQRTLFKLNNSILEIAWNIEENYSQAHTLKNLKKAGKILDKMN